jgi:hypothetical protein
LLDLNLKERAALMGIMRKIRNYSQHRICSFIVLVGLLWLQMGFVVPNLIGNEVNNRSDFNQIVQKDDEFIENVDLFEEIPGVPINSASNPRNLTDSWKTTWNGTAVFPAYIEYDSLNEFFYTCNSFTNNSIENSSFQDVNVTKRSYSGVNQWNVSIGKVNVSHIVQEMIIPSNGSILYVMTYIFTNRSSIITAIDTALGQIIWEIEFNSAYETYIADCLITDDDRYLYLAGESHNGVGDGNSLIWKVDLFSKTIIWNSTWGTLGRDEETLALDITDDGKYIYCIGMQYLSRNDIEDGYMTLLQYNSSGSLFHASINTSQSQLKPADLELSLLEDFLYILTTDFNTDPDLALVCLDLAGNYINQSNYNYATYRDFATSMKWSPWNNSFYIIGQRSSTNLYSQAYVAEISINGTMLWENRTIYYGEDYFEAYYDFVISDSNEILTIMGYSTVDINGNITAILQLYQYNLSNVPPSPYLFSNDQPSSDQIIVLNWTNSARANNYSIYRSNSKFSSLESADLIAQHITDLNYSDTISSLGLFYYRVVACGDNGNSTPSNLIEMYATNNQTPYLYPLKLNPSNHKEVRLNWTIIGNAVNYHIYRNESSSFNYSKATPIAESTFNYFQDDNVPAGIWYYSIICEYNNGSLYNSSLSNNQSISIVNVPQSPVISILSDTPYVNNITIGWSAIDGASQYQVYRTTAPIEDLEHHSPIDVTIGLSFTDDVYDDNTYYWQVVAVNGSGASDLSNQLSAYIYSPILPPVLLGEGNVTDGHIHLTWAQVNGTETYYIYKNTTKIVDINTQLLYNSTNSTTLEFHEYNHSLGVYFYVIVAGKMGVNSSISNCINISVQIAPEKVTGLNITNRRITKLYLTNDRFVNLSWNLVGGVVVYDVYRFGAEITKSNLQFATLVGSVSNTTCIDYTVSDGNTYYYSVCSRNASGSADPSINEYITVEFFSDPVILSPIYSLNRSAILNWTVGNYSVNSYWVYRHNTPINASNWDSIKLNSSYIIAVVPGIQTVSYIDLDVEPGTWFYVVAGENNQGIANFSNCQNVTIKATPYQPLLYQPKTPNHSGNITLNWTYDSLVQKYYIFRANSYIYSSNLTSLTPIAIIMGTNEFNDTGVSVGWKYYAVIAYNSTGNSTLSNCVSVHIILAPYTPLWNSPLNSYFVNHINLSWSDSYGYGNYSVFRGNSSDFYSVSSVILISSNLSSLWIFDNITYDAQYYYWIISYNATGPSYPTQMLNLTGYYMPAPTLTLIPAVPVTNHTVKLVWDNVPHATGYYLYRACGSQADLSALSLYKTFIGYNGSFIDQNVPLGNYTYLIIPYSVKGNGDSSNFLLVRVEHSPPTPTLLSAKTVSRDSIIVFWEEFGNYTGDLGFIVYMSLTPIDENTSLTNLFSSPLLASNVTNFTFIKAGFKMHYFVLVSVNATGSSGFSNIITFDNSLPISENNITLIIGLAIGGFFIVVIPVVIIFRKNRRYNPKNLLDKYL